MVMHGPAQLSFDQGCHHESRHVQVQISPQITLMSTVRAWIRNNRTLRKLCRRLEKDIAGGVEDKHNYEQKNEKKFPPRLRTGRARRLSRGRAPGKVRGHEAQSLRGGGGGY